ncbi:MAG: hypothetical protein ACKE5M_02880 [Methylophilaceae bacterium]
MKNHLIKALITLILLNASTSFAGNLGEKIDAITANGDKVVLNPNGRWEYIDKQKASEASKIAKQHPENKGCPPGAQGGWFGTKCILPGDKAFNRKSRIGK